MFSRFFKGGGITGQGAAAQGKVILVGAGEVGTMLARRLAQDGHPVVIIDVNPDRLQAVRDMVDAQAVPGSGAVPSVLRAAGVEEARFFLAVTNNDETNLVACMLARALAPEAVRLARVRNPEYARYPQAFGAGGLDISMMVSTDEEVVRTIDRLLSLPGALDYAQFAEGRIRMVEYKMDRTPFVGQPLTKFREILGNDGVMVAAILRSDGREDRLIIPDGQAVPREGDTVYFVYRADAQRALLNALGRSRSVVSSACIVGGGNIGLNLARRFESRGVHVKLIERDAARCDELAAMLASTLVLHGDGTDKALLEEEQAGRMDVLAAVTGDEESNILSCLLAKSLGVRDTVAKIDKSAYLPLLAHVGIDHSISARMAAVNRFLNYIRGGKVLASASVGGDAAEILEVRLAASSPYDGKALRDLQLPKNMLLLAVQRGEGEEAEAFIPNGSTTLASLDHLILLGTRQSIAKLNPLLASKTKP